MATSAANMEAVRKEYLGVHDVLDGLMRDLAEMAKAGSVGVDINDLNNATKDADIPSRIKVRTKQCL